MDHKRFTDARLRSLKPKNYRYEIWEGGGFGVRVATTGKVTFIYLYRFEGRPRRMSLNAYPTISLATAREQVAQAQKMLEIGMDPATKLVQEKKSERGAETVADLCEEYMEKWAKPHKRSWKEDERILLKDIIPAWGWKKAHSIERRDVITLLDGIIDRGAPIQANRTLACIRKMFNFALNRDIVKHSPCTGIQALAKENRRDRKLNEQEIKLFWDNLPKTKMSESIQIALKLQLVTAQRKGEVIGAEWSDIDLEKRVWDIPAEKAKNDLPHRVPLSATALKLIEKAKTISGNSRWLFPTPREKDTHILHTSVDHALIDNLSILETAPLTPHDLRRTATSFMAEIGIPEHVLSKVLSHVSTTVTGRHYNWHDYDEEKRQALDAWARKLESIIISGKREARVVHVGKTET